KPKVLQTSSYTKKDSIDVMGWNVTDSGFEVIFSKEIPTLVNTIWKNHLLDFLKILTLKEQEIDFYIAHPGGMKVLLAIKESLNIASSKLKYSYEILAKHGNMSSATVFYVLQKWMKQEIPKQKKSIITALGPGFSSELLFLEWI